MLYDAVAVLPSSDGASTPAANAAAKDFVTDAHVHCKFIGRNEEHRPPPKASARPVRFLTVPRAPSAQSVAGRSSCLPTLPDKE